MAEASRKMDNNRRFELNQCPLIDGEANADVLLDYCNRKLAPELSSLLEQHMEQCPACAAFAESQKAVWSALDAFEALPVSQDFDRKLMARIEREGQGGWSAFWHRITDGGVSLWRPAVPLAAALLLAVGLWIQPGIFAPAPTAAVDAEQLETALEDLEMLRQLATVETAATQPM
jgi:hypothetical protein